VKTDPASKKFRRLYRNWQDGAPGQSDIVEQVHMPEVLPLRVAQHAQGIPTGWGKQSQLASEGKRGRSKALRDCTSLGRRAVVKDRCSLGTRRFRDIWVHAAAFGHGAASDDLQYELKQNTQRGVSHP
jgi:hypothetical protein